MGLGLAVALLSAGAAQAQGGKFKIEIVGCPVASANIDSVFVGDLVIDQREMTTGADWDYRVYGPGDAHFGSITIRSKVPHPRAGKNELHNWWLDVSKGKNIRKSISVDVIDAKGNQRKYNFIDCFPTRWEADTPGNGNAPPRPGSVVEIECTYSGLEMAAVDNGREAPGNVGVVVEDDDGSVSYDSDWESWSGGGVVTVDERHLKEALFHTTTPGHKYIDTLTLRGPVTAGRKALCDWITVSAKGQPWKRMLTVKEILKDGSDGKTFTYHDCFPIRYVFPSFSANATSDLYEEIHIKPIRLELK